MRATSELQYKLFHVIYIFEFFKNLYILLMLEAHAYHGIPGKRIMDVGRCIKLIFAKDVTQ